MRMNGKVLIVGGGAMGTSVALGAAKRCDPLTEPVILLERDALGSGSSGRMSAIIHQGYRDRMLAGMARDALKVYAGMGPNFGRSVGYKRTGVLVVAGPEGEAVHELERDVAMQSEIGIDVRMVGAAEMRRICPGIEIDEDAVGSYEPQGGFVDPMRTIGTFAALARSKGATTRTGVTKPEVIVEGGRAVGVATSEGEFRAPNVVLATGAWTTKILEGLGVDLPLRVVRTEETFMEMPPVTVLDDGEDGVDDDIESRFKPDPLDLRPAAHPVIIDRPGGMSIRCEPKAGRSRAQRIGTDHLTELERPKNLGSDVDPEVLAWMRPRVEARMPVYSGMEDVGGQTAWVTLTPDGHPIAGPIEAIPGLWIVAGFSGNDFQLAPSIGEGLAQMIVGDPVSAFAPEFFDPSRFGATPAGAR